MALHAVQVVAKDAAMAADPVFARARGLRMWQVSSKVEHRTRSPLKYPLPAGLVWLDEASKGEGLLLHHYSSPS